MIICTNQVHSVSSKTSIILVGFNKFRNRLPQQSSWFLHKTECHIYSHISWHQTRLFSHTKLWYSIVILLCKQYYFHSSAFILSSNTLNYYLSTHWHSIHCSYSLSYQSPLLIYCLMYHSHFWQQYIFSMLFTLHSSQFITHLYYFTIYLYVIHNFFSYPPHIITFFTYHINS